MSVTAISRQQVKQASKNLGEVLKAQADYVVQALDELLTNQGDQSEHRSIVIAGVQNIKVRDFILCHIVTHESEQELGKFVKAIGKVVHAQLAASSKE